MKRLPALAALLAGALGATTPAVAEDQEMNAKDAGTLAVYAMRLTAARPENVRTALVPTRRMVQTPATRGRSRRHPHSST